MTRLVPFSATRRVLRGKLGEGVWLRGAGEAAAEELGGGGAAELLEDLALACGETSGGDDAAEAGLLQQEGVVGKSAEDRFGGGPSLSLKPTEDRLSKD